MATQNHNETDMIWSVSDFVAVFNQTIEYAYPSVTICGELANFKISKNKWIYFDLKDEYSSIRFFGSVYSLSTVLEDGMLVTVNGSPRLHPQFGFSITVKTLQPVGEGSIKRANDLLKAKLAKEGLFNPERKRQLPYPPKRIGLITSGESAAYKDFIKIISVRWGGLEIEHYDVQVQGEFAPSQIIEAFDYFNSNSKVEVIVVTRGGGSAEDMSVFSTEQVTRAVAASRVPTLVAIGHEIDVSLAELAADLHASTPSNAAEILTPDKKHELRTINENKKILHSTVLRTVAKESDVLLNDMKKIDILARAVIAKTKSEVDEQKRTLRLMSPQRLLQRGYSIVYLESGKILRSAKSLKKGEEVDIKLHDGKATASINRIELT